MTTGTNFAQGRGMLTEFQIRALSVVRRYHEKPGGGISSTEFEDEMGFKVLAQERALGYVGGGHLGRLCKRGLLYRRTVQRGRAPRFAVSVAGIAEMEWGE